MSLGTAGAYITGLFDKNSLWQGGPTQTALVASEMTEYIFWSIHVSERGELNYNDATIVQDGKLNEHVAIPIRDMIADARANGAARTVRFSIGSGDVSDYANIQAILDGNDQAKIDDLYGNFQLLKSLGADGFDFHYEEVLSGASDLIAELTVGLSQKFSASITYCPHYEGIWLPALQNVYKRLGYQPVQAYNLQCYSGGAFNVPSDWTAMIKEHASSLGIADADAFVRPVLAVYGCNSMPYTPAEMSRSMRVWRSAGAAIWNTSWLAGPKRPPCQFSISDYADAITAAATALPSAPPLPEALGRSQKHYAIAECAAEHGQEA